MEPNGKLTEMKGLIKKMSCTRNTKKRCRIDKGQSGIVHCTLEDTEGWRQRERMSITWSLKVTESGIIQ